MIPARHPDATLRDSSQNATLAAAPARPASPAPQIDTVSTRESNPLFLRLSFPKGLADPSGQDAAPRSPSSRSKAKAQRAITENRGRKRAIDGKDGPGSPATGAAKRQKESSPPASPRSGTSSPRYLVKQSRPVKDLKTMAGLSPRRAESASPPSSPRSTTSGGPSVTDNLPAALQGKPAPAASLAASGTWAHGSASIGSSAPPEALAPLASSSTNDGRHPGTTGESAEEFTFADVAFGDNGEAYAATAKPSGPLRPTAPSNMTCPESLSISSALIRAELLPKAMAQQQAAASYLAALDGLPRAPAAAHTGNAAPPGARLYAFQAACAGLETAIVLCDMALQADSADDILTWLGDAATNIAHTRTAFAALAEENPERNAAGLAATRQAVSASLDELEIACRTGIGMLADDGLAGPGPESSTTAVAPGGPSFLTPADEALLAELEVLMDRKI